LGRNDGKDREEAQAGLFYARKRMDFKKKTDTLFNTSSDSQVRPHKKMGGFASESNELNINQKQSSQRNSSSLSEVFQQGGANVPLLSHAQCDMQKARMGTKIGSSESEIDLFYTSEQKMLREQVLASLRKLDSGEFTRVEFQDKIFTMGIELPEKVLKLLKLQEQTGLLDWSGCVKELDGYVFKHVSMQNKESTGTIMSAKKRLENAIFSHESFDPLTTLLQIFQSSDTDKSGDLCYSEFKISSRKLIGDAHSSSVSDDDLRILFNSFDHNGDGKLSYYEFIRSLQGEITPLRLNVVNQAFTTLDRHGLGHIPVMTLMSSFRAEFHPSVFSGAKTEWKVRREVQDFFEQSSQSVSRYSIYLILYLTFY
jgi:hypothetical protein